MSVCCPSYQMLPHNRSAARISGASTVCSVLDPWGTCYARMDACSRRKTLNKHAERDVVRCLATLGAAHMHACSLVSDCDPMDSCVRGILHAGTLEWVAMPSFRGSSQGLEITYVSCIGRQVLYHQCHLGSQDICTLTADSRCTAETNIVKQLASN